QSNPYPQQEGFIPTLPFTLTFNMPMDTASTEAAVNLNPAVALEFRWRENNSVLGIVPQARLDLGTTYELSIGQEAQSASGQATLDQPYLIPFTTVPLPGIIYTDPTNGQTDYPPENNGVFFEFASPMDWESFVDDITVEPAPNADDLRLDYYEGNNWLGVRFPLTPQTEYVVTIPATAADPYGNTLGEDYVLRFTTGDYYPYYTPSLPGFINHFSTSFPTNLSILQRNNSRIDVALYDAGLPLDRLDYYDIENLPSPNEALNTWGLRPQTEANSDSTLTVQLNDGDALPTGVYYLTMINDDERERGYDPRLYLLVVADTNLVVKEMVDGVYVWATNLETGQPAANLSLSLFDYEGETILEPVQTNASGLARFDYAPPNGYFDGVTVLANAPREAGFGLSSSRWTNGADPWQMNLPHNPSREEAQTVYLFTDRPLYRPGHTVYFRGYLRDNNYGRFSLPTQTNLTVVAEEYGFYGESEPFRLEIPVTVDENGGFDAEFDLPEGARLGSYGLTVLDDTGSYLGGGQIQVAAFRKPEFEVSVSTAVDEILRGQATQATVQATYFFGGPAANLNVQYTVSDSAYTPNFSLPYSFNDDLYSPWYYDPFVEEGYFGGQIFSGEGTTDGNGQLIIDLPADLLAEAPEGSRQITIEATVRDVSNQIVANRASQIHHTAASYVGIQADGNSIFRANQNTAVNVITVDWAGEPVPSQPVEVNFFRRDWVRNDETGWYEPSDTLITDDLVTTDADGEASASFVPDQAGQYRAQAVFRDAAGRTHRSSVFFWVSGGDPAQWRPDPASRTMTLVPNADEYTVGDTAQILVQSPFTEPVQAWLTIERGRLLTQELITLQTSSDVLNIPITLDHAPNVFVSVTAVKGVTESAENPYADLRLGVVELPVSPDPFALNLSIVPQAEQYEPGDTAVFDIVLTNNNGQPISADLTLALVDQALLSLASDNAVNILDAFYGRQPYRSAVGAGLLMSAEGLDLELLENFGGMGGGGGGDVVEEAAMAEGEIADDALFAQSTAMPSPTTTAGRAAANEAGGIDVRTEFEDTAYWQARLTTDENGRATVEIPLPDNLTTWQLNVKAMSDITLVGQGDSAITVQKPLLLRPITPRFFTLGDEVEL
ncbi:MAG: Ig-like domain-containing protein, partial [Anaerolineales bacterium]|nr:Ig-like domain-containing protein [Anaerolineales bacterium]